MKTPSLAPMEFRRGSFYAGVTAALALALLALLAACSSDSGKPAETKPEVKGPELITARSAFQKLYIAARAWNQDAKPYRIESTATSDGNGQDGKWAVWRASFASANQRSEKSYTWSGSAANGAPERGVNPGIEDSYSASNTSTQVFDMAFENRFRPGFRHGPETRRRQDSGKGARHSGHLPMRLEPQYQ